MVDPKDIQRKYANRGIVGYLLGAMEYSINNLNTITMLDVTKKDASGDIVTLMDTTVHHSIAKYFRKNSIPVVILGEEGVIKEENAEYILLIDEIEGTQNAINGLPFGINLAIAPYKPTLRVKDLEAAIVCNSATNTIFVGEKNKGAYKIKDGGKLEFSEKHTDIYELPSAFAYTKDGLQEGRQLILSRVASNILGNQPRSIDATGTRLVELLDSNIKAYCDWRNATKCWDILPSRLILIEKGFILTDTLGFSFSEGIIYDESIDCPNAAIGRNFIAANAEDHENLVFGDDSEQTLSDICTKEFSSVWGYVIFEALGCGFIVPPGYLLGWQRETNKGIEELLHFGRSFAYFLHEQIDHRLNLYGGLDKSNVMDIINKIRSRFLDVIPEEQFPEGIPHHLMEFDRIIELDLHSALRDEKSCKAAEEDILRLYPEHRTK